jgi:hypothetical protein
MSNLHSKAQTDITGTGTAPLLYWLAVICGLTGITVIRMDEPAKVVPIWFGAIVGIALGQLVALLRIRVWSTALAALMSSWIIGPAIYIALCELFGFGTDTETALLALLPAFVCGYASLTERGGLLAFWYPAMLWMLVILDGESADAFAPRAYLPMALGLGAFFVAFLRARETRRASLWRAYSHQRLAKPGENAVLSGSPVRGMSQLAFTALMGGGAFLLAAWVAPNLFQKDRALHTKMTHVPPPVRYDHDSSMPCCPESWQTEKVREYMPLKHGYDSSVERSRLACTYCPAAVSEADWGPYATYRGSGIREMHPGTHYGYDYGYAPTTYATTDLVYSYNSDGSTTYSWNTTPGNGSAYNYGTTPSYTPPSYEPYTPPPVNTYTPPPVTPHIDPPPVVKPVVVAPTTKPVVVAPTTKPTPTPVVVTTPKPVVAVQTPKPIETPKPKVVTPTVTPVRAPEPSAPWGVLLPLMAGVFLVPLGTRFVRRQVTLRHLARPFWKETVDQRISNHWQRMLIGLRDAGIQLRATEQPGAFAKRIAIKGMEDCATILERVRHGVRIEDEDLATMGKATDEIYATARKRAGAAGRIAGSFRWPLV